MAPREGEVDGRVPSKADNRFFRGGLQVDWEKIKPGLLGAVCGAIVLVIIGFSWGGWVSGGTAREMAEEMAGNAVVARLAPICVEQFKQDSAKDRKLEELKREESWRRDRYIEKQGWATMPGETKSDNKVAGRCAEMIVLLGQ